MSALEIKKGTLMSMPGLSEILVIVLLLVVIFGAKRLPQLGEGVGKALRNFKEGLKGETKSKSDTDSKL